jgi:hypothetical protein
MCLANPAAAQLPVKVNVKYAFAAAIANRGNKTNAANFFALIERFDPEFMMLATSMALRGPNAKDLQSTPAFTKFVQGKVLRDLLI